MGLGRFAKPPAFVDREARAAGPIAAGTFRVVAYATAITHHDFESLEEARRYADDVASEGDYDDAPPAAWIVDSNFKCIDIGRPHGSRR